jgi:hypothetical protein
MDIAFPAFIANDSNIKGHMQAHIADMSNLLDRKKEGIVAELGVVAKLTAVEMSKADQFGMIYKSVIDSTNVHVSKEALKVRNVITEQMNQELEGVRRERQELMRDLSITKRDLEQSLAEQRKFKWMAGSGFIMSLGSMASVAYFILKPPGSR